MDGIRTIRIIDSPTADALGHPDSARAVCSHINGHSERRSAHRRRTTARAEARGSLSAFTLIELLVVIAIVAILLGLTVPSVSSMWRQRGEADSINTIRGLLESARSRAIQKGEYGLFFYVDNRGIQRIKFIEADPGGSGASAKDIQDCEAINGAGTGNCITQPMAVNRFRVVAGESFGLQTPYRAAAGWSIELNASNQPWPSLMENQWGTVRPIDTPRNHRNFFAIVFDRNGQMVVDRDVLIHDADADNNNLGDATGMPLPISTPATIPGGVDEYWYWDQTSGSAQSANIGANSGDDLYDMILVPDGRAANFRSVSGAVVYDDSQVTGEGLNAMQIRNLLLESGQTLVVSRFTGDVIVAQRGG